MGEPARRCAAALLAAVACTALLVQPAGAQEPVDLGAYGLPLRFEAPPGVTLEVPGQGRYTGVVETRLTGDGLVRVINDLPMQQYVEGIAEMPARWPLEALKAQAVAARTYGWYQLRLNIFADAGYDICDTTACQVFRGREVVETPVVGDRWRQAVAETEGEVLLHDGEPILARYFSTSGGHTVSNEEVFSEGPRPYLQGVPDAEDAVSPLHRWRVEFTREQMDEILAHGQRLSAVSPAEDLELVEVDGGPDLVRVTGRDGTVVEVEAPEFRGFVSSVAPDLFPGRFPTSRSGGEGSLPTTLPSSRISFTVTATHVVIDGRGWGHGVGMGQWGAMGKAEQGMGYRDILAAYYGGLRPETAPGLPARIRVGLAVTDRLQIRADGPFRVAAGGTEITDRGLGTWTVRARPDRSLGLEAPAGYGAPLIVSPTTLSRDAPTEVEVVAVETVVNKAVELTLEVQDRSGTTVLRRDAGVFESGRHAVDWSLEGDAGPLDAGEYAVRLVATDEDGVSAGEATRVRVQALEVPGPPPSLLGDDPPARVRVGLPAVVLALLGAALGAVAGALVPVRP